MSTSAPNPRSSVIGVKNLMLKTGNKEFYAKDDQ